MSGRVRNPKAWRRKGALAATALALLLLPGCGGGPKEMRSPPGPSVKLKPEQEYKIEDKRKVSISRRERVKLLREAREKQQP